MRIEQYAIMCTS